MMVLVTRAREFLILLCGVTVRYAAPLLSSYSHSTPRLINAFQNASLVWLVTSVKT